MLSSALVTAAVIKPLLASISGSASLETDGSSSGVPGIRVDTLRPLISVWSRLEIDSKRALDWRSHIPGYAGESKYSGVRNDAYVTFVLMFCSEPCVFRPSSNQC